MCLIKLAKLKVRLTCVSIEFLQLSFLRNWPTLQIGGGKVGTFSAIPDFFLRFKEFDGYREVHQSLHEAPLGHECLASVVKNFWIV